MSHRADSPNFRRDGNLAFSRGVDSNAHPAELTRDQVAFAVNTTFRGARGARPRPGWRKCVGAGLTKLDFATGTEANFTTGMFQHAGFYDGTGRPAIITHHGGRLFKIDLRTFKVSDISVTSDLNSASQPMGWHVQMENYFVYQDNQSLPIIYDGASSRRSNQQRSEVPVGNVMEYTMGRLTVALRDRTTFRVGDLVFGSSGTAEKGYRDACLRFTENSYLNEGGEFVARVFGAPSGYGPITSMRAVAMSDTSLGQGPLLVGTPDTVFTLNLPFDRDTWKDLASPLQTVTPIKGPRGQNSTVLVNGDAWYRTDDGFQSYVMAKRDFSTSWGNAPMSAEIDDLLSYDSDFLLEYGSGVYWNKWLIQTVSPVPSSMGVYHRGCAVIDMNPVGGIGKKSNPQWEGLWTGLKILQLIKGRVDSSDRCFALVLGENDLIELWELVRSDKDDNQGTSIQWSLDTPSYNCGNSDQFKRLETGRLVINNLWGTLTGTVKYRSDQNPCWQTWDTFSVCAKNEDCGPAECAGPHTYQPQPRAPIRLKMPADTFDTITGHKYRTGYEFQTRFELTGYAELRQFRIFCLDEPDKDSINVRTQT